MALVVTSAPWQQVSMPALDLRRFLGAGINEGILTSDGMATAQRAAGANMSVDLGVGEAAIQGDTVANQGRYFVLNDAVFNLATFTAAHAILPRIDRVTLRVRDAFHGDAANDTSFQVVTGTATAGATLVNLTGAAAVPANSMLVANILVPAAATSITTANIDNTVRTSGGAWVPYTPVWTTGGTAPVLGNGTLSGRWVQIGKTVHAQIQLTAGATTTFGTGSFLFSLPVTAGSGEAGALGTAQLFDFSVGTTFVGLALVNSNTTAITINDTTQQFVTNVIPYIWAVSDVYRFKITYETV